MVLTMQNKRKNKILKRLRKLIPVIGIFILPLVLALIILYLYSPLLLSIFFLFSLVLLGIFKEDRVMFVNLLKFHLKKLENLLIKDNKDKYYKIKKDKREDL